MARSDLSAYEDDRGERQDEYVAHVSPSAGFAGRMFGKFHEIGSNPVERASERPGVHQPNLHRGSVAHETAKRAAQRQPGFDRSESTRLNSSHVN